MAYQLQEINRRIQTDVQEFLAECDDNYAQRVSLAADKILTNLEHSPIVLLSGPSGSGKTTTAMKIAEELQRRGVNTHAVAMDNYFHTINPRTAPRTLVLVRFQSWVPSLFSFGFFASPSAYFWIMSSWVASTYRLLPSAYSIFM